MANPGVIISSPWPMPNPRNKEDLHFKGKHINVFLSKYECHADRARLTEVQRCEHLRLYFSKREKSVLDILEGYQNHNWSQLIEELLPLYTSLSESYTIALHEEKSRWKDPRSEFKDLRVTDSPAFEPQSDSIPELASLPSLCDMCREPYHSTRDCAETVDLVMLGICYLDTSNQILMSDGSALPQAEGEDGIAKVIHRQVANRVPTPALESFDSEFIELTFDSNGEDTEESMLLGSTQIGLPSEHNPEYEVTSDAEFSEFTETSSTRLYEDLAPVDLASTMSTSYSSHDYKNNIEGFVSEEEEREISVRKMHTLANPLDLRRTLNLSYEPYNRFRALSMSQRFPIHLMHTSNMRLIRISILKSIMKLDNTVKCCVSVDVCGDTKEAVPSIPQVSSGESCETLIQLVPKRDSAYQMKSIELKSVPASVDESSSGSDLKVWDSICPSVAPNYMSYEYDFEWPVGIWKNDVRRLCRLFIYLVIWTSESDIPNIEERFQRIQSILIHEFPLTLWESKAQKLRPINLVNEVDRTAAPALTDLKEAGTFEDLPESMEILSARPCEEPTPIFQRRLDSFYASVYDYMSSIDDFVSVEEEGTLEDSNPPFMSKPSVTSEFGPSSSPFVIDQAFGSALTHAEDEGGAAQTIQEHSISELTDPESLVESELELRNTQSTHRILLAQAYPYCLRRAPGSSFEPDHLFHAGKKPQHPSVHSARAKNMEVIHASLRRSDLNFDKGVEWHAQYDVCGDTKEADPSVTQVSSRDLCDISIQHEQKRDLGYPMRIAKLKHALASSYEFSATISVPWTSRIGSSSRSMVLGSGFNLDVDDMQQAPDLALMDEAFDEPWMIAMLATPHSSYEISGHSLMHYLLAMTHFGVRKSEQLSARLDSESQVRFRLELPDLQSMLQVSLAQLYSLSIIRAPSPSFEPDRRLHAITKSLRFLIHSAHALNQKIIRVSWSGSFLNFGDGVELSTLDDIYVYAGEAAHSVHWASLKYFRNTSIHRAMKRNLNLESQVRNVKWKLVPASSYESSTTNRVPQTIQIENSSRSILLSSNDENAWQAPEPELLYIQTILQILLTQSYPLVLTNAPSMSIKLYHRLRAATKSQRFSVCSVCTKDLDVVHAFSRRSILNFDDAADCCVPDDGYLHAEEVNPPLAHVSVEEFHDISTQHARKWDFGYLTGIFELKPIPASSYDFSTTTRVPQKNQIDIPSRSMLICSGFDLNVKNEKLMDASGLHEGISWSLSMSDETSQSAKNSREHLEQVYDIVRAVVGTFKNGTRRACPLFVYLVVWAPKDYIAHTA